ncbi:MAG: hypothetical protein E6Z74_15795 [Clostridium perfringens]|uniref:hypothetical protein n=1 Tax=Clostridium perfringens TaxID=1502 RepID=UPI0013E35108|nr:hypothetical protein [Clostridium perfringens]MCX0402156.1 hypothetical protein [Clostridium perfringens]MDU5777354.1 hypothetical protein [Clostridium perfringens]NGT68464.1 hypothetical protein [Clostridium perfringens]
MINLTYEDALTAIDKLINELESIKENKEFEIKNITERYLIIDALALLEKKLDEELREKLEKNIQLM